MFAKSRTWIVHKDRYGNTLPTVQYRSDFRVTRNKITKKTQRAGRSKHTEKMEGFSTENYMQEVIWMVIGVSFIIGLLYYIAPEIFHYLGL